MEMNGCLKIYKGIIKGYKAYDARIEEPYLVLVKKGKTAADAIKLLLVSEGSSPIEVYPLSSNQTDFLII